MAEMTSEGLLVLLAMVVFGLLLGCWGFFVKPWLSDMAIRTIESGAV